MKVEVEAMIETFKNSGAKKYLEVGARYGDTFYEVMRALPKGSKGVCVDLPGNVWGTPGTEKYLDKACKRLTALGYDITMILGDSTDPGIIKLVKDQGPFDAALLDGDHRYNGIKADFEAYAPMCKVVALHDIVGTGQRHDKNTYVEVPRFWEEIKTDVCVEFVGPGSAMGIGVKWMNI
jgi:cephalosporin hydroxylase